MLNYLGLGRTDQINLPSINDGSRDVSLLNKMSFGMVRVFSDDESGILSTKSTSFNTSVKLNI